jgi:fructan beta-fructosidase
MRSQAFAIVCLFLMSCQTKKQLADETVSYQEQYRPQFHFSPEANWMNDPNGLVYVDGEYHLFYQYYPDSTVWGPMHWGHAVSEDMIHWKHLPIALYPDSLGFIFSGSAVVDYGNTTQFGSNDNPAILAVFTQHDEEAEKAGRQDFQTQSIAYSQDHGRTWAKYKGNPVVSNPGKRDFRDPRVFWHVATSQWIMILAVKDHVEFYGSPDLKDWVHLSDFGKDNGAHGGVWECPDLFELDAGGGDKKWVMLVSINPGGYQGGSGTQYFIGQFDGKEFRSETREILWLDYGKDNYAGVTWNDVPQEDGRRLFLGWMSNWQYAKIVPTVRWRSAMTIPRVLSLANIGGELYLAAKPVVELASLREKKLEYSNVLESADSVSGSVDLPGSQLELVADLERSGDQDSFAFEINNDIGQRIILGLDAQSNTFYIDRTESGEVNFSKDFPGKHVGTRRSTSREIKLTLLLDTSSIELFADDGTMVMTELFFPDAPFANLRIHAPQKGVSARSVEIYPLRSIWAASD